MISNMIRIDADRRRHPLDPGGAPYTEYERRRHGGGMSTGMGRDRGPDRRKDVDLAKEISILPYIVCRPMRAKLTLRACEMNQNAARELADALKREGDVERLMGHGSRVWALLVACGGCPRCEGVTERDIARGKLAVQGMWNRFGVLPLHYTDPEYRRLIVLRDRYKRSNDKRRGKGEGEGGDNV